MNKIVKFLNPLNIVFAVELIVVVSIAADVIPRIAALFLAGFLVFFLATSSFDIGVRLFVRSIPFFIALPLTDEFDSLNMWRIALLTLAIRWLFTEASALPLLSRKELRRSMPDILLALLALFAILSLAVAGDTGAAVKRIIYFANAGIIFYFVRALVREKRIAWHTLGADIALSGITVVAIGFFQLAMTYIFNIYQFAEIWYGVAERLYGHEWSFRAKAGNTWFAYLQHSIKLRVFANLTSSHTFGLYTIMALPFLAVLGWMRVAHTAVRAQGRKVLYLLTLALVILGIILSGTRGIWFAGAFPIALAIALLWFDIRLRIYAKHLIVVGALAVIMFMGPALFIYATPQFTRTFDSGALFDRFASTVDFNELSNEGRRKIWRLSLQSIVAHPFLGVGIGNYPVILGQEVILAKSGSSAHNAYLHVASEMGIPAGVVFIGFLLAIFFAAYRWTKLKNEAEELVGIAFMLALAWIYGYILTDASLFDERVLLGFLTMAGIIIGRVENS